ncbi:MAG: hypothetical protein COA84_14030 [Robiginitomaculum sp.]|nr:MAG: hypothetical protein COA84_14030 [Robiginitomaculum sp.]
MPDVVIYAIISAAVSFAVTQLLAPDEPEDNGATINKSGTSASRNPVYGTCVTGAVPVWNNVDNNNSEVLVNVFACGVGVTNVIQVYIDDVAVLAVPASYRETPTGGTGQLRFSEEGLTNGFEKQCEIQVRAGLDTGIPLGLAIEFGDGEWNSNMRGDRVCAVAVKSKRITDQDGIRITSDSFKMNLLVDGLPVYDPRFHSIGEKEFYHSNSSVPPINRQCGRNPALALLDYLTDTYFGMSLSYEYIDLDSFIAAANWTDSLNIKIDGQIDNSSSFNNAIDAICKSGGLTVFVENGFIKVKYEDIEMVSHDFGPDNIINGTFGIIEQSSSNYSNVVEVEFKNTELNDEQDTYTLPENVTADPTVIEDGRIETETLSMPMTRYAGSSVNDSNSSVKLFANRTLLKNKFQKQVEFDCDLLVNNVKIFEVITVTDENLNWDKKEFRVTSIKKSVNSEKMNIATLSCVEYSTEVYTGTSNGGGGGAKPIKPVIVSPPTNLVFTLHDLITTGSCTLSWSRTWYETDSQFDVEFKTQSSAAWTTLGRTSATEWKLPNLYPDTYDFRVRTNSNLYGSSNWTELLGKVVSQLGTFPPVTGLGCIYTTKDALWTWDNMLEESVSLPPDADPSSPTNPLVRDYFSNYQIDILDGSTLIDSFQAASNEYTYTFEQNVGRVRVITANVYIVALDGTKSQLDTGSIFTATNNQCSEPEGVLESTELSNTIITWDAVPESDYRATRFYTSLTKDFTPSDANFLTEQVGTIFSHLWSDSVPHYIRFAHVDVFGNDDLKPSAEITATPNNIGDLLPIDPRFEEIRNPDGATGPEQVFKSASGEYVAGIGIYADEATKDTTILMAAENILMGAGGRPFYDNNKTYLTGDKVLSKGTVYCSGVITTGQSGSSIGYNALSPYGSITDNSFHTSTIRNVIDNGSGNLQLMIIDSSTGTILPDVLTAVIDSVEYDLSRQDVDRWVLPTAGNTFSSKPTGSTFDFYVYGEAIANAVTGLFEAKTTTTGNLPTNTTYWTELQNNVNQAVFSVEEDGRVLIKNAVIDSLTSDNIQVRSIVGDSLEFDTIQGNTISSATTITAGNTPDPYPIIGTTKNLTSGSHTPSPNVTYVGFSTVYGIGSLSSYSVYNNIITELTTFLNFGNPSQSQMQFESSLEGLPDSLSMIIDGGLHIFNRSIDNELIYVNTTVNNLFGASKSVQFLEYTITPDSTIAGMNGVDDGTGTGVDGIRFWSGISEDQAHNAPFIVDNNGAMTATDAFITGEVVSTNYVPGLAGAGYRMTSGGFAEFSNITVRGTVESSYIYGSFIEGSIIVAGTDIVIPTVADTGAQPRYVCYAQTSGSAALSATSGFTNVGRFPMCSANYHDSGFDIYPVAGIDQQVAINFNRSYDYYFNVDMDIDIDTSLAGRGDDCSCSNYDRIQTYFQTRVYVWGVSVSGAKTLLSHDTLHNIYYGRLGTGTYRGNLAAGWIGEWEIVITRFSSSSGARVESYKVKIGSFSDSTCPTRFEGQYEKIDIQVFTCCQYGNTVQSDTDCTATVTVSSEV